MLRLVIGNKNYSSWSLRAWLLLKEAKIEFEEIPLELGTPSFHAQIPRYSAAGRVPVLLDGELAVWDTLAIAEYLAENFPHKHVWPAERADRARARSMCAEMHSGFAALRSQWPMNISANLVGKGWNVAVQKDLDRLVQMWRSALKDHPGPFLFGPFGAVDAFFAPVMARFATYGAELPPDIATYRDAILGCEGMRSWIAAAHQETAYLADDEPYRLPEGS